MVILIRLDFGDFRPTRNGVFHPTLTKGQKFFLQGYMWEGKYTLWLERWEPPCDYGIWEAAGDDKHYPLEEFLQAKLWDGRTFWEAEAEMEWTD